VRALTISAHGGLERLEYRTDLPEPVVTNDADVRVRVYAAALNHLDLFVLGGLPGVTIAPPWVMGADAAGVVDQVGSAVRGISVGDFVLLNPGVSDGTCQYCQSGEQSLCVRFQLLGEHRPGTFAEYVVVPAVNVQAVPAPAGDGPLAARATAEAAAFTLVTLTAWRMVVTRARVTAGDQVLIWGIGGGVAQAALQIAKARGARVWVTSGHEDKLERAAAMGADEIINHRTTDVGRAVRDRTAKRGVDVIIDSVGQASWAQSLGALGRAGRLVTCGATSGPMVETDLRRMFWNQWTLMGSTMGNETEFAAIAAEYRAGRLRPPIDSVFPLEEGREAFARLQSDAQFGKVVIDCGGAGPPTGRRPR
jgi:NADPH:quinone reductase-like Zn-dependent oxidoreductase